MTKIYTLVWKSKFTKRYTGEVFQEGEEELMMACAEQYKRLSVNGNVWILSGELVGEMSAMDLKQEE